MCLCAHVYSITTNFCGIRILWVSCISINTERQRQRCITILLCHITKFSWNKFSGNWIHHNYVSRYKLVRNWHQTKPATLQIPYQWGWCRVGWPASHCDFIYTKQSSLSLRSCVLRVGFYLDELFTRSDWAVCSHRRCCRHLNCYVRISDQKPNAT